MNSLGWVLSAYAANVQSLFITFGVAAGKPGLDFFLFRCFVHLDDEFNCGEK